MRPVDDWVVVMLGTALIVTVAGIVAIVLFKDNSQLAGTGLGALAVALVGGLTARVRTVRERNGNGKDNHR